MKYRQIFYFGAVGTLGFLVDAGILYILINNNFGYIVSRIVSFICAVMATWQINRKITFGKNQSISATREMFRYYIAMTLGGIVNYFIYVVTILLLENNPWSPFLGLVAGSIAGMCFNFIAAKKIVYKENL